MNAIGSLASAFDKAHGNVVKFCTARGYLFSLVIVPTMAVMAINPTLIGIGGTFLNFAFTNLTQNLVPGYEILAEASVNAVSSITEPFIK